jgi:hypothetical protein
MVRHRRPVKRRGFAVNTLFRLKTAPDERRRALLIQALSLGATLGSGGWLLRALATPASDRPVYRLQGEVLVNGKRIDDDARIGPGDTIRTGSNSLLVTRVGEHGFLVRENSTLELAGTATIRSLRLLGGKVLSLFAPQARGEPIQFRTVTATIGIRGTAVYAEAYPDRTYLCTCYGETTLASVTDPKATEDIRSRHHDAPRWIVAEPEKGRYILPAPVINHGDEELEMLEAMLGRGSPYGREDYERPRREY